MVTSLWDVKQMVEIYNIRYLWSARAWQALIGFIPPSLWPPNSADLNQLKVLFCQRFSRKIGNADEFWQCEVPASAFGHAGRVHFPPICIILLKYSPVGDNCHCTLHFCGRTCCRVCQNARLAKRTILNWNCGRTVDLWCVFFLHNYRITWLAY